ncbi:Tetratricopeptide repeat protein 28 [Liparis tanakae]|uniref:Tetratricopeptide repeat protein 28 n=1 Tax=Liparis tanakae TaxID=230148 RepID=A0A4Z2IWG7_9TELE|nr:Tetratricopeptide repeat protein 28 [Liparis tanakae]
MESLETSRVEEWAESQQGSGTAGGRNSRSNHRCSISRWDLCRLIGIQVDGRSQTVNLGRLLSVSIGPGRRAAAGLDGRPAERGGNYREALTNHRNQLVLAMKLKDREDDYRGNRGLCVMKKQKEIPDECTL